MRTGSVRCVLVNPNATEAGHFDGFPTVDARLCFQLNPCAAGPVPGHNRPLLPRWASSLSPFTDVSTTKRDIMS